MKELINILFGEDIKKFKAYTRTQKAVCIYAIVSLLLLLLMSCGDSITVSLLALANLAYATFLCYKYIPDFNNEE